MTNCRFFVLSLRRKKIAKMKKITTIVGGLLLTTILLVSSCTAPQKAVMINGQKVPITVYSNEKIQADAYVLTYLKCETELFANEKKNDSTNGFFRQQWVKASRKQKMFFNRMSARYFQNPTYKKKFQKFSVAGEKIFKPCQKINAIRIMEASAKKNKR